MTPTQSIIAIAVCSTLAGLLWWAPRAWARRQFDLARQARLEVEVELGRATSLHLDRNLHQVKEEMERLRIAFQRRAYREVNSQRLRKARLGRRS